MIKLRALHKIHESEEYIHIFTAEELKLIESKAKKDNISVQKVVKEFAKTCSWEKAE